MKEIKITYKLIITIIIVTLLSMLVFEMAYSKLVYDDYSQLHNKVLELENKIYNKGVNNYGF